jgi:hypothetical protein
MWIEIVSQCNEIYLVLRYKPSVGEKKREFSSISLA